MGTGAEEGLAAAVLWLRESGPAGILLGAVAIGTLVLAVRVQQGSRPAKAAGPSLGACGCALCTARASGVVDARTGKPPNWHVWSEDAHQYHVGGYTDPACGQCTRASAMSLTEYLNTANRPMDLLPDDVRRDVVRWEQRVNLYGGNSMRLWLRGGEVLEFPNATNVGAVTEAVRGAMRTREQAALESAGAITDPVAAAAALELLYLAAGWQEPVRYTGCECCGADAKEGCIVPPGADQNDPDQQCQYMNDSFDPRRCTCWGGLRKVDGETIRICEDCWLNEQESSK